MADNNISKEKIFQCINSALDLLYKNDEYLIKYVNSNIENDVSERGIVFRFGIYFDWLFRDSISSDYHIDTEYNRNIDSKKQIAKRDKSKELQNCYPDFIVHHRGDNKNNLLILEFKTWWNSNQDDDERRIEYFTDYAHQYKYRFGATVYLDKKREECKVSWFSGTEST